MSTSLISVRHLSRAAIGKKQAKEVPAPAPAVRLHIAYGAKSRINNDETSSQAYSRRRGRNNDDVQESSDSALI